MNERVIQYIWQFQLFNKTELATTNGEAVTVIHPGQFNTNQGPDFINARIKIGNTTWAGTVELHIRTSDWKRHRHDEDKNYENVVLHVVWEHDISQLSFIPVMELSGKVPGIFFQRYDHLMKTSGSIACQNLLPAVSDMTWRAWKERVLVERLMRKVEVVQESLKENGFHWEETFWILLAKNFGVRVNSEAFEAMARSIPLSVLGRHKDQIHQLEALLFGQAGLLESKLVDEYPRMLQREYQFLRKKYRFRPIHLPLYFLRMRPRNFPSIRLAQLAMLVHSSIHLFSKIKECESVDQLKQWFDVIANDYWHYHYRFDEASVFMIKKLGDAMVHNIIINTIVPVLFCYGKYYGQQKYIDRAVSWLEMIPPEKNSVISEFARINVRAENAADSQVLLEMKNEYCNNRRCLECGIGHAILKCRKIIEG